MCFDVRSIKRKKDSNSKGHLSDDRKQIFDLEISQRETMKVINMILSQFSVCECVRVELMNFERITR